MKGRRRKKKKAKRKRREKEIKVLGEERKKLQKRVERKGERE